MDINLLVLGVGNSRLAVGAFAAGELVYSAHILHRDRDQLPGAIQKAWSQIADSSGPAVAAASVYPELNPVLDEIVKRETGQTVLWVGRDIDVPVEVRTENPSRTGIDRILNIAAAYEQMGKACVVVDAGTAVTVDCCDDRGEFLGGAIAPGLEMMLDALHEKTAGLPRVSFAAPGGGFADSTESAVSRGFIMRFAGWSRKRWGTTRCSSGDGRISSPPAATPRSFLRDGS